MKTIYKYYVNDTNRIFDMEVPKAFQLLDFQHQEAAGGLVFWAVVDSESEKQTCRFLCIGTGIEFPKNSTDMNWSHVGTSQDKAGFVWHLFIETPRQIWADLGF